MLSACRALGIKSVAVTAGEMCAESRTEFYRFMDAANVDLKGFREKFYHEICAGHLQPVLDTLVYLKHETDVWFEITNLVIPGVNDTDEDKVGRPNDVHYQSEGYEVLAAAVAASIEAQLTKR